MRAADPPWLVRASRWQVLEPAAQIGGGLILLGCLANTLLPDDLGIGPEFLGRVRVGSSLASLLGIWLYRNYLQDVPLKRLFAALSVTSPSGQPPYKTRAYSIAGNTKLLEGGTVAPEILSTSGPVRLSRYPYVHADMVDLIGTESSSIFAETYSQIVDAAVGFAGFIRSQ